ncbi:sodium/proton antiporter family protein [Citrifermentans bemidjiense Bem]|uniref:Sodium/proton antiporter family protein n=1 Tax=Citrifermentans bemidjiense (strain ATCC BAA-1014 / DSM 16622 / JCM 12645 / Bem) TaxID=404380 RepID=B5EAJ9_CITBB|nr:Na+/H+ antiporter NhaA [Citrifermentans bemidjiense]ACH40338.1 sodium/proton antiporter family protein [Citrifermentans bemidjiense Bem]
MKKQLSLLQEFSIPLVAGVILALAWANLAPEQYHHLLHDPVLAGLSLHFITNDLFMTFFFGMAAVEITQSCLPGGDLHPLKRAVNPLLATAGGVLGPVAVYLLLNGWFGAPELARGWGIPTATDIALAWLAARFIFGKGHPAISFLLLLAIADDAVGLAIIAVFYGDPNTPAAPAWLLLTLAGMAACYWFRSRRVTNYWPYLVAGGVLSWSGLFLAHLHPALALVFVIPFLPHPSSETAHLFELDPEDHTPLSRFEHDWKLFVDLGLFVFGLVNAGVSFGSVGPATWLVLAALLGGKAVGIVSFALAGRGIGFPLPVGMGLRELVATGLMAGIGFTVALFVAGEAFSDPKLSGAAKMGAMLSLFAFVPAAAVERIGRRFGKAGRR